MDFLDLIETALDKDVLTLENLGRGARISGERTLDGLINFRSGVQAVEDQYLNGLWRTIEGWNVFNSDRQIQIAGENEAFVALLEAGIRSAGKGISDPIGQLVLGTMTVYVNQLPPEVLLKLSGTVQKQAGKYVAKKITERIVRKVIVSKFFKEFAMKLSIAAGSAETGAGLPLGLLGFQGLLQEASYASRRLQKLDPILHSELRRDPPSLGSQIYRLNAVGNPLLYRLEQVMRQNDPDYRIERARHGKPAGLDMLYFLAEPYLKPYVTGIALARRNKQAFITIVKFLGSKSS